MKYIINLYNTVTDAQAVADRLGITGTVLLNLKTIHVEDPTQEQVDASWPCQLKRVFYFYVFMLLYLCALPFA